LKLAAVLPQNYQAQHVAKQMTRCATAVAANYGEVRGAESRADFVHKLRIVLKELNETEVWLTLIAENSWFSAGKIVRLDHRKPGTLQDHRRLDQDRRWIQSLSSPKDRQFDITTQPSPMEIPRAHFPIRNPQWDPSGKYVIATYAAGSTSAATEPRLLGMRQSGP